jgi:hypothetical protein
MTSEVGITAWKGEWQYNEDDFLTTTRMNKDRESLAAMAASGPRRLRWLKASALVIAPNSSGLMTIKRVGGTVLISIFYMQPYPLFSDS